MESRDPVTGFYLNKWPKISGPAENPVEVILSLGAGVQSTALALMAARGDIGPMPTCAFFSDTGDEPRKVYAHLAWLETQVPFPIIRIRREGKTLGEYHTDTVTRGLKGRPTIPLYTANPKGMMGKQCSKEFKTRVVQKAIRERLGLAPRQRAQKGTIVEVWLGISKDEMFRAGTSETAYIHNRHPLIEADMTRQDCLRWMESRQYPRPPKSSCKYCPFRDNASWIRMGREDPEDFSDAIAFDEAWRPGYPGMIGETYVHRDRIPLRDLDLTQNLGQLELELPEQEQCDACGF